MIRKSSLRIGGFAGQEDEETEYTVRQSYMCGAEKEHEQLEALVAKLAQLKGEEVLQEQLDADGNKVSVTQAAYSSQDVKRGRNIMKVGGDKMVID